MSGPTVMVYGLCDGRETLEATCELSECFPDESPEDYADTTAALLANGMAYVGGGALPAYLLVMA